MNKIFNKDIINLNLMISVYSHEHFIELNEHSDKKVLDECKSYSNLLNKLVYILSKSNDIDINNISSDIDILKYLNENDFRLLFHATNQYLVEHPKPNYYFDSCSNTCDKILIYYCDGHYKRCDNDVE